MPGSAAFVVVGVGADGWDGLTDRAREELRGATTVFGSARQLRGLPTLSASVTAWRSPMSTHLDEILADPPESTVHVIASGDPMLHGVGATIAGRIGAHRVRVIPTVSSVTLAAARLGWDLASCAVLSVVTGAVADLVPELSTERRLLILSRDGTTPESVAALLVRQGFAESPMWILEQLGGRDERLRRCRASQFAHGACDPLNVIAVECAGPVRSRLPGLPDQEFDHDGQLTKQAIRALTICALRPGPFQRLWDVGAGSGSISVEWLRAESTVNAVAFEIDPQRARRVVDNAQRHGVADRLVLAGAAPGALSGAPPPDVVFIGGGVTDDRVVATCWNALRARGRMVVNAVTVESESLLLQCHREYGGSMTRVRLENLGGLGSMTAWRPALPLTQWSAVK